MLRNSFCEKHKYSCSELSIINQVSNDKFQEHIKESDKLNFDPI